MANICENTLNIIACNNKAIEVIKEISKNPEQGLFHYIRPKVDEWLEDGEYEDDIWFDDLRYETDGEHEIQFEFITQWSSPFNAVKRFQESMKSNDVVFSISLSFIDDAYVGYYIDGEEGEVGMLDLQRGLNNGDEKSKSFANKMGLTLKALDSIIESRTIGFDDCNDEI